MSTPTPPIVELPPTFRALQQYITPTPPSPSLPEDQSDYTTTPDCNLFLTTRGVCMVDAICCKMIQQEPIFSNMLNPASSNVVDRCGPFLRELAKHDDPSQAVNTGGLGNWITSTALRWTMWWNHKANSHTLSMFTKAQWDKVYQYATEDEKAQIFCIKPASRRPSLMKQLTVSTQSVNGSHSDMKYSDLVNTPTETIDSPD